jgi:hypothetical protein
MIVGPRLVEVEEVVAVDSESSGCVGLLVVVAVSVVELTSVVDCAEAYLNDAPTSACTESGRRLWRTRREAGLRGA